MLSLTMAPETVILPSVGPVLKHCFSAELRVWTGQKNQLNYTFFQRWYIHGTVFNHIDLTKLWGLFPSISPATQHYLSPRMLFLPSFKNHCCPQPPIQYFQFSFMDGDVFSCDYPGVNQNTHQSLKKPLRHQYSVFSPERCCLSSWQHSKYFSTHLIPSELVLSFSVCPTAHYDANMNLVVLLVSVSLSFLHLGKPDRCHHSQTLPVWCPNSECQSCFDVHQKTPAFVPEEGDL